MYMRCVRCIIPCIALTHSSTTIVPESTLIYAYFIAIVAAYAHYIHSVINEICDGELW